MDIAIDGMNLALDQGTGVATYARNLSVALHALGHRVHVVYGQNRRYDSRILDDDVAFFDAVGERHHRVSRALEPFRRLIVPALSGRVEVQKLTFGGHVDYRQFGNRMPQFDCLHNGRDLFAHAHTRFRLLRRFLSISGLHGVQVAHWTYPIPARVVGAKNIYTLHDLVPLKLPHTTLDDKRFYLALVRAIAANADLIVTVSEQSKRDILAITGAPSEKVIVTYQAVEVPPPLKEMSADQVGAALEATFNLKAGGYFFFVGAIEPKKNVSRLIEGYLASNVRQPLVIAGPMAWMADKELHMYHNLRDQRLPAACRIRLLGYLSYSQLVNLMRGARALVFPSLYEGFGLPPLEAMSVGCPVITSNVSSLPEVCGDAAYYVDPYQVVELRDAFRALAEDNELREQLRSKGFERAARFSAEAYKERLRGVYERVMKL